MFALLQTGGNQYLVRQTGSLAINEKNECKIKYQRKGIIARVLVIADDKAKLDCMVKQFCGSTLKLTVHLSRLNESLSSCDGNEDEESIADNKNEMEEHVHEASGNKENASFVNENFHTELDKIGPITRAKNRSREDRNITFPGLKPPHHLKGLCKLRGTQVIDDSSHGDRESCTIVTLSSDQSSNGAITEKQEIIDILDTQRGVIDSQVKCNSEPEQNRMNSVDECIDVELISSHKSEPSGVISIVLDEGTEVVPVPMSSFDKLPNNTVEMTQDNFSIVNDDATTDDKYEYGVMHVTEISETSITNNGTHLEKEPPETTDPYIKNTPNFQDEGEGSIQRNPGLSASVQCPLNAVSTQLNESKDAESESRNSTRDFGDKDISTSTPNSKCSFMADFHMDESAYEDDENIHRRSHNENGKAMEFSTSSNSLQDLAEHHVSNLSAQLSESSPRPGMTIEDVIRDLDDPELQFSAFPGSVEVRDQSFENGLELSDSFCIDPRKIHEVNTAIPSLNITDDSYQCHAPHDETFNPDNILTECDSSEANVENNSTNDAVNATDLSGINFGDEGTSVKTGSIDNITMTVLPKTMGSKKNFCFYCKTLQSVISRHLVTVHRNEDDVKKINSLPRNNPERRKMIEVVRRKGNYIFNTDVHYNKLGELIVARRPSSVKAAGEYQTCHNCRGAFRTNSIRRHRQGCLGIPSKHSRTNTILSRCIEGRLHQDASDQLVRIFSVMREDDIVRLIKYDKLLIVFANGLAEKYRKQQQHDLIRSRLRILGRFLRAMKDIDPTITDFKSIYHPQRYDIMLKAVNLLAGFDSETGEHRTPSIVTSLGIYLKAVGQTLKLESLKSLETETESLVDKYLFIHKHEYSMKINRVALETQSKKHRQQAKPLPLTDDIKKLSDYLCQRRNAALEQLKSQYSYELWLELLRTTLITVQIFNRRRAGEIERALIADLTNAETLDEKTNPDIYKSLSAEQQQLVTQYTRFVITGKLGRDVPVLLDTKMSESLQMILSHRSSTRIAQKNPYIFGIPGFTAGRFKYLRSCELMRQYSLECGAKHPDRLRGTFLRKHIATNIAAQNVSENQIVDVATFMGHAEAIHRKHYRQSVIHRDVIGVGRFLREALETDGTTVPHETFPQSARLKVSDKEPYSPNVALISPHCVGKKAGPAKKDDYSRSGTSQRSSQKCKTRWRRVCRKDSSSELEVSADEDNPTRETNSQQDGCVKHLLDADLQPSQNDKSPHTISRQQKSKQKLQSDKPARRNYLKTSSKSTELSKRVGKRKRIDSSSSSKTGSSHEDEGAFVSNSLQKYSTKKKMNNHQNIIQTQKKPKKRWTDEEKSLAFEEFGNVIRNNKLPTTKEIRKFLIAHPLFQRTEEQELIIKDVVVDWN